MVSWGLDNVGLPWRQSEKVPVCRFGVFRWADGSCRRGLSVDEKRRFHKNNDGDLHVVQNDGFHGEIQGAFTTFRMTGV